MSDAIQMHEDRTNKLLTVSQGNRSISLSLPKFSQGEARVLFWKQGDIDDSDLPVLGHIMSLANDLHLDQLPLKASPFGVCSPPPGLHPAAAQFPSRHSAGDPPDQVHPASGITLQRTP